VLDGESWQLHYHRQVERYCTILEFMKRRMLKRFGHISRMKDKQLVTPVMLEMV